MTLLPTKRGAWLAPVAIVAATYAAGLLGNLAAGPELPQTSTGGERPVSTTAGGDLPPVDHPRPSPSPSRASRSRAASPAHGRLARQTHGTVMSVTAYCWTGNRTASGVWPQIGMAAGPWPFGTKLRVEGVGIVTVADRYGWGTALDIYMGRDGCEQRAREFGRRSLRVEVVR